MQEINEPLVDYDEEEKEGVLGAVVGILILLYGICRQHGLVEVIKVTGGFLGYACAQLPRNLFQYLDFGRGKDSRYFQWGGSLLLAGMIGLVLLYTEVGAPEFWVGVMVIAAVAFTLKKSEKAIDSDTE
jgi:hypothetical protein